MKKELALELRRAAEDCARVFSRPERELNHTGETFTLYDIKPLRATS